MTDIEDVPEKIDRLAAEVLGNPSMIVSGKLLTLVLLPEANGVFHVMSSSQEVKSDS